MKMIEFEKSAGGCGRRWQDGLRPTQAWLTNTLVVKAFFSS
jgi:hypothetical protein